VVQRLIAARRRGGRARLASHLASRGPRVEARVRAGAVRGGVAGRIQRRDSLDEADARVPGLRLVLAAVPGEGVLVRRRGVRHDALPVRGAVGGAPVHHRPSRNVGQLAGDGGGTAAARAGAAGRGGACEEHAHGKCPRHHCGAAAGSRAGPPPAAKCREVSEEPLFVGTEFVE